MAHGQGATSNKRGGYGAFGRGSRGHGKDKSVKKAEQRQRDPRWREAAEAVEADRAEVERLIAAGDTRTGLRALCTKCQENPPRGTSSKCAQCQLIEQMEKEEDAAAVRLTAVPDSPKPARKPRDKRVRTLQPVVKPPPKPKKFNFGSLRSESLDTDELFALTTAKLMVQAGYHIKHVIEYTGVGWDELSDLYYDDEGYGCKEPEGEVTE